MEGNRQVGRRKMERKKLRKGGREEKEGEEGGAQGREREGKKGEEGGGEERNFV